MTTSNTKLDTSPMALVKLLRGGLLTLPAKTRQKFGLKDGDYLEAVEVEDGVLLRPARMTDRKEAWRQVLEIVREEKWKGPEPKPSPEEREEWLFDLLAKDRQGRHD